MAPAPTAAIAPRAASGRSLADPVAERRAAALRFTWMIMAASLLLQRFGLPLGTSGFDIVGPVGVLIAMWAVFRGTLALNRFRTIMFLFLALCSVAGLAWHAVAPSQGVSISGLPSLPSLLQFLMVTSFAVLSFAEAVDERAFFRIVTGWFAFIAVAGILEFAAQFAGLDLFAFSSFLPARVLFEAGYNLRIPLGVGHALKSNGFFLLEPSMMSQFMALGLIIEILAFRRPLFLALFVVGMLLSFSGTGWIVLASFIVAASLSLGWRGVGLAAATVVLLALVLTVGWFLFPAVAHALADRANEFSQPGTSGHDRFVTPFWVLSDMLSAHPSAAFVGLGSGISDHLSLPYEYDTNTPIKTVLELGFPALAAYVLVLLGGRKSGLQASLVVPCAVLLFLTGSYQQFAPMVFPVLLLIGVARLDPAAPAATAAA